MDKKKNKLCGNCGLIGHVYKNCLEPLMSFGIILYKKETSSSLIKYLLIQRKDSIAFVEFIRGRYNIYNDYAFLIRLFEYMTQNERKIILENDFDIIWNNLWISRSNKSGEYKKSKIKFDNLKHGIQYYDKQITIQDIINSTKSKLTEQEWGFPKGRRNLNENDLDCAVREFSEETNISQDHIIIFNDYKFEETFKGINNLSYKYVYYLAYTNMIDDLEINVHNKYQFNEIRDIQWFSLEDAKKKIRKEHCQRTKMLETINNILIKQNNHYDKLIEQFSNVNLDTHKKLHFKSLLSSTNNDLELDNELDNELVKDD